MELDKIEKICSKENFDNVPSHIAFIMDGNGRWAKKRGLNRLIGHGIGADRMCEVAIAASELGIKATTFYAFSTENWKRPKEEIDGLFELPKKFFDKYLPRLDEAKIKINYIGDISKIPNDARTAILEAVEKTKDNAESICTIAINYGARQDIVMAVQKIIDSNERNIDEDLIAKTLSTSNLPEVDLMVRTSGELRLSNFLLWELSYAEFEFNKKYWPQYDTKQLIKSVKTFNKRVIRKGGQ